MKKADVVSNTSPLIFLEKIDLLPILKKCFKSICIPECVQKEWDKKIIPDYISVHTVSALGNSYIDGKIGRLHRGELEAIQLAIEMKYKIVLMDDLLARRFASKRGLIPLGVLGILKIACQLEILSINKVKVKVSELMNDHGLYISSDILKKYFESF